MNQTKTPKFRVGQKVRLIPWSDAFTKISPDQVARNIVLGIFQDDYENCRGHAELTVSEVDARQPICYTLDKGEGYTWPEYCLEAVEDTPAKPQPASLLAQIREIAAGESMEGAGLRLRRIRDLLNKYPHAT